MVWSMTVVWLLLLIVLVVIELLTMGLTCVWFAIGSVGGLILSLLDRPVWMQILVFVVLSVVTIVFTRPLAVRFFNKDRVRTNTESLIGRDAIVVSEIDNLHGIGQVTVGGQEWSAKTEKNSEKLPVGAVAEIIGISGVRLIVRGKEF